MDVPLSDLSSTKRTKMLSRPDSFILYGELGVDFFSTSELLYANKKNRLRLIRARANFIWLTATPTLVLKLLIFKFTLSALPSRMIFARNEWTRLDIPHWRQLLGSSSKDFRRCHQSNLSILKIFLKMLQFVGLLLQWLQKLQFLDCTVKFQSGINIWISDKLENSEVVSQF